MNCHIMFDIDGTLTRSYDFDSQCFADAVRDTLGIDIDTDWNQYQHVTDSGILRELLTKQGIEGDNTDAAKAIKNRFIKNIGAYIATNPVAPVAGATEFIAYLQKRDISLSLATGGWRKTAELKLASAGFSPQNLSINSADDHFSRTEIMKRAAERTAPSRKIIYFGDGPWDKRACETLGWQFIAVGDRTDHARRIQDFRRIDEVMGLLCMTA